MVCSLKRRVLHCVDCSWLTPRELSDRYVPQRMLARMKKSTRSVSSISLLDSCELDHRHQSTSLHLLTSGAIDHNQRPPSRPQRWRNPPPDRCLPIHWEVWRSVPSKLEPRIRRHQSYPSRQQGIRGEGLRRHSHDKRAQQRRDAKAGSPYNEWTISLFYLTACY